MKTKTVLSVLVAMIMASGGFAIADDHRDRNDRGRNDRGRNEQARDQNDRRYNDSQRPNRPDYRGRADDRRDARGAGPNHAFHRGGRLPMEYRSSHYVVDDWRGHRLSSPPRGYHWVQTGGDYVLVAIGSGIILQLLLNN